jgi:hypothetical protein
VSVRSGWGVALAAVAMAGCVGAKPESTESALAAADRDAAEGRSRDAVARYETIVKEHPNDPDAAEALHRLAMLRLEPGSALRDRRTGLANLRRLATEYGSTLPGREARAWRQLLGQIDRCEAEAAKRGADVEKLRQTLESIKDSDLELEQRP